MSMITILINGKIDSDITDEIRDMLDSGAYDYDLCVYDNIQLIDHYGDEDVFVLVRRAPIVIVSKAEYKKKKKIDIRKSL